ncbi:MAG: DUF309 domain-containing protein [Gemmataceae bacterium]
MLPRRLFSDVSLPPYAFVPGRWPHPVSDPKGHSFGKTLELPRDFDPERWRCCAPYLQGIDLFNHGYYWEAHEAWESLWHVSQETEVTGDFLKGLIKLAAAGVKAREGQEPGVRSHATRAAELFGQVAARLAPRPPRWMGLDLTELAAHASNTANQPPDSLTTETPVVVVFDFELLPW